MPRQAGNGLANLRDYRVATSDRRALMDASAMARQHGPAAIAALVRGLRDPERYISAATALLDRGYGRPAQHVTTTAEGSMTVLHLLAAKAIAAELPTLEAKADVPEQQKRLHLFDVPDE